MRITNLKHRNAIITGASQGLGFELAVAMIGAGASVCICARDAAMLEKAADQLRTRLGPDQKLVAECGDVSKQDDVARIVTAAARAFGNKIDILVNNAGIYGPKGFTDEIPWQEWLKTVEINLFGSVFMARAVVPYMRASRYGKIIQLSGGGATQPMPRFTAYAASKAAVVRFADSLAEELREFMIDVNSIAAGALNTRFLDEVLSAGPDKVGEAFYKRSLEQRDKGGVPFDKPVDLALFLSSADSDGITGKIISALWDNWQDFPSHKEELQRSDVYSIRRIVGKDRGFTWGDK
jgi:NAD(P)-dependent dehydrogenase (short-subunit alcohol dehydrogenase family)